MLYKCLKSCPWLVWKCRHYPATVQAKSRPMNAIVERMLAFGEFEIFVFGDDCILNKPISEWPTCECLLSWHSDGFPLIKAYNTPNPSLLQYSNALRLLP